MSPAVTPRRENTRVRLLDAAAEVFAEVGMDGASVEAVCERAGFTRGAFYSNFESKDQLFLDLAARVQTARLEGVRARIEELTADAPVGPDTDLAALVRDVMEISGDDRCDVLLMSEMRIRALRDPQFAEAYLRQEQAMLESIEGIVRDVQAGGGFVLCIEVPDAARMLLSLWETAMVRGTMAGLEDDALRRAGGAALAAFVEMVRD